MASEHDIMWRHCARLGQAALALMDQEPDYRTTRHAAFAKWGIDVEQAERLLAIFASLAVHSALTDAVAAGSPSSIETLHAIPLSTVSEAMASKQYHELLAGLPASFQDDADQAGINIFRLASLQSGRTGQWLLRLGRELQYVLRTLTEHSPGPAPTCGDLYRQAQNAGLPP
ncbi:hypothetical protein AB0M57_10945 [Streptomyces sp. NPDC051597]|uniref:hypothetical protein n=1 Tax=Streptomyces sp. NPDC051597 TaxID=3155049 RepID=UPI00342FC50C